MTAYGGTDRPEDEQGAFRASLEAGVTLFDTAEISVARFVLASRSGAVANGTHPASWLSHAAWGSAGWWLFTIAMGTALCMLAWQRHA